MHNETNETYDEKRKICTACKAYRKDCKDCNYQSLIRYNQECGECVTSKATPKEIAEMIHI